MKTRIRRVTYEIPDGRLKIRWIIEKRVAFLWLPCKDSRGKRYEFRNPIDALLAQPLAASKVITNPNDTEYDEGNFVIQLMTMPHVEILDFFLDRGINEVNEEWDEIYYA